NTILRILEDAYGNLWMSTYDGLAEYQQAERRFRKFSTSDGLQSMQYSFNAALTFLRAKCFLVASRVSMCSCRIAFTGRPDCRRSILPVSVSVMSLLVVTPVMWLLRKTAPLPTCGCLSARPCFRWILRPWNTIVRTS